MIDQIVRAVVKSHPEIVPFLKGKARWIGCATQQAEYKTYDFFLHAFERLVINTYNGLIAGDFIDVVANLISGQLYDAYERAWMDDGNDLPLPYFLQQAADNDILIQYDFVDQFYRDIVDARIDKTPIAPLLQRVQLWANRYNESYNNGVHLIELQMGGKEVWRLGRTEKHCPECEKLNGVVAYAVEWEQSGYEPQNAPNLKLTCGGWKCDCSKEPTTERLTRKSQRYAKLGIR